MDYNRTTARILYNGELQSQKKYIMDNFDFYTVQKVMNHLKWDWWNTTLPPSIHDMKKTAERLLDFVIEDPDDKAIVSSGGFQAEKLSKGRILLQFVVTEWAADSLDEGE